MGAFEYVALDERGREKKGVLEGEAPRHVRAQLRERGMTPLEVEEVSGAVGEKRGGLRLRRGIGGTELSLFTRQLATLVQSGLPLEEALLAVSQQTESRRTQTVALGVRSRVTEGRSLASALRDFPHVFSELYVATCAAGESSGKLDGVLERLAEYVENQQYLRQKVQMAMFYPGILLSVALLAVALLMTYVVPKVVTVFEGLDVPLPALTRGLIAVNDFITGYGWFLLGGVVLAVIGVVYALRQPAIRRRWHLIMLRLPLIGRLTRGFNTARFTRTFSILVGSGVPVLDALRVCGLVVQNIPMREAVEEAARRVREGSAIHRALAESRLFPPITLHLIANGEASGTLDVMLERAAANQEREVELLIARMIGVFEPVLILTMGLLVLLIVLAILVPIFNMSQLIK